VRHNSSNGPIEVCRWSEPNSFHLILKIGLTYKAVQLQEYWICEWFTKFCHIICRFIPFDRNFVTNQFQIPPTSQFSCIWNSFTINIINTSRSFTDFFGYASVLPFLYIDHFHIFDLFCTLTYRLYFDLNLTSTFVAKLYFDQNCTSQPIRSPYLAKGRSKEVEDMKKVQLMRTHLLVFRGIWPKLCNPFI